MTDQGELNLNELEQMRVKYGMEFTVNYLKRACSIDYIFITRPYVMEFVRAHAKTLVGLSQGGRLT